MWGLEVQKMIKEWRLPHVSKITEEISVKRALPFRGGRGVGPFVFLDHMGPHHIRPHQVFDVAPHPHIGLSTLTYLFEGELDHRDSLGTVQRITPGAVNWMTAGRGIVHSERTPKDLISRPRKMHGLQAWVALPVSEEERSPAFEHIKKEDVPTHEVSGLRCRIVVGEAFGQLSPVTTFCHMLYVQAELEKGGSLEYSTGKNEIAFYLVEGEVDVDGQSFNEPGLLVFEGDKEIKITTRSKAMGMLLGGEPLKEHRTIWWNFVASKKELIEDAKNRWLKQQFDRVPGETEFVPLPD